jgi:Brp/Blh family beta-carotene 15,15'-monooxygenase
MASSKKGYFKLEKIKFFQRRFDLIRMVFILVAMGALIHHLVQNEKKGITSIMMAEIIAGTIGLAHGSLDWSVAKLWGLRKTTQASVYFIISYVLCALMTLGFWQIAPCIALAIFLLMSIVHFAGDWQDELSPLHSYMLGTAVICLPTLHQGHQVQSIFTLLLSGADANLISAIMFYLAIGSLLVLGFNLPSLIKHFWIVVELLLLIVLAHLLSPIIYFAIYFCFLHAPKHWQRMHQLGLYHKLSEGILSALWPTFVTVILGVLAIYHLGETITYNDALCKTLFMGLAALTVPHWILIEIYSKIKNSLK